MVLRPFLLPIKILRYFGIWQEKNSSKLFKFYGVILFLYLLVHGSFLQSVFVVEKLRSNEMKESFETLSILLTCFVTMSKTLIFFGSAHKVRKLMKNLNKLLKFSEFSKERPHIVSYENSIIRFFSLNFTFHFTVCNMSLLIAVVFFKEKRLPFKSYVYFDYENDLWAYFYTVCLEYSVALYVIFVNGSFDAFPIVFMCYVIAILKELNEKIQHLRENMNTHQIDLRKCVNLHVELKKFCEEISDTYSLQFIVQFFFSALLLCSSTFLLTKVNFRINF